MQYIKFIKKNPLVFDDSLKKRNLPPCSSKIVKIHNEYLEHLNLKQKLLEEKNSLSKSFANKKDNVDKIKKLVLEEIVKIREQEDTNAMIDEAQKAIEQEASATFGKIKAAAEKAGMETGMLKGLFIQFLQNME